MRWGLLDQAVRPVTLHTSDDVVSVALDTLRDDTETVVLHGCSARDTAKETLLNTLAKLDHSNTGRGLIEDGVSFRWWNKL